jgi:copper chaperone CopZ
MQTDIFKLQPIHGAASAATLTQTLEAIEGVVAVAMSNPDGRTTIKYDTKLTSRASIDTAVTAAGYRVVAPGSCCGGCGG